MRKKAKKQRVQEIRQNQKLKREKKKINVEEGYGFKPGYCQGIIDHCSQGYSFESFAAFINVQPEILEKWIEMYPEFKNARVLAAIKQQYFWEKNAIEACSEKFSITIFRHFTGIKDENTALAGPVVEMPKEEISK